MATVTPANSSAQSVVGPLVEKPQGVPESETDAVLDVVTVELELGGIKSKFSQPGRRVARQMFAKMYVLNEGLKSVDDKNPDPGPALKIMDEILDFMISSISEFTMNKDLVEQKAENSEIMLSFLELLDFVSDPFVTDSQETLVITKKFAERREARQKRRASRES